MWGTPKQDGAIRVTFRMNLKVFESDATFVAFDDVSLGSLAEGVTTPFCGGATYVCRLRSLQIWQLMIWRYLFRIQSFVTP